MRREMVDSTELVAAVLDGKPWAAHALVTTVAPVLLGYAELVGGGLGQADREAAVEAAITRGVEKIERYDAAKGTLAGWLRPFVRHALGDIRRRGTATPLPDIGEIPDAGPQRGAEIQNPERAAINRALARLSRTDQLILHLRDSEQLTYEQCAERIGGVTAGAGRVRHHRALRRLSDSAREEPELAHYFEENA
jgi:RNA polymerase sigma factor (sigma-70 family)